MLTNCSMRRVKEFIILVPPNPHEANGRAASRPDRSLHVGFEGRDVEWVWLKGGGASRLISINLLTVFCFLFSVFGPLYLEFDFIFDFIYKLQMADILVGLRCLQSFSLALLTLSIRFFSSIYTFFGASRFLVYLWLLK